MFGPSCNNLQFMLKSPNFKQPHTPPSRCGLLPPAAVCHPAPLLPRLSRETRLCVWYSSEAARLKMEWGGTIRAGQTGARTVSRALRLRLWLMLQFSIYMNQPLTHESFHSRQMSFAFTHGDVCHVFSWKRCRNESCPQARWQWKEQTLQLCGQFVYLTSFASLTFLTRLPSDLCHSLFHQQGGR